MKNSIYKIAFLYAATLCISMLLFSKLKANEGSVSDGVMDYDLVKFSTDKNFYLKKFVENLPQKKLTAFTCGVNLEQRTIKVTKATGEDFYQISIPKLVSIDARLSRSESEEEFTSVEATDNGDLILRYHEMTEIYYSNSLNKYSVLPRYLQYGVEFFQFSTWEQFGEDLFAKSYSNRSTIGGGYAIFDAKSKKIYKLTLPNELMFKHDFIICDAHDSDSNIVSVERYTYSEPANFESEMKFVAECGNYKIILDTPEP